MTLVIINDPKKFHEKVLDFNQTWIKLCKGTFVQWRVGKIDVSNEIPNISDPVDKITKNQNNFHRSTSIQIHIRT